MPLLLVCTLLTLDLTLASFSNNLINLIIRPAGRSRSFKWLGRGSAASAPLFIPRPIFIPRWIPQAHPQYTAKWVPTLPPTHSSSNSAVGTSHAHGFGSPKANSIIKGGSLHGKMVAPSLRSAALIEQMHSEPSNSIVSIDIHPRMPADKFPTDTSGFEPPHEDDILTTPLIGTENESEEFIPNLTTLLSLKEDTTSTNIPILNLDVRNKGNDDVDDLITDLSVAESITLLSMPLKESEPVEVTSPPVDESQSSDTRRIFQVYDNDQFAEIKANTPFISAQPRLNNDMSKNNLVLSDVKSSPVQRLVPSGRAIPYPVAFPIGPLGSVTLDFPEPSEFSALQAGVRSSRAFKTSPYIPYGSRLHPISRSYTKRAYYG